jgi:hypothetical protein
MIWRFSDGTTVALGGEIAGSTALAESLRLDLASGRARAQVWPPPGGSRKVHTSDAAILDRWLRDELDHWTRVRGLKLTLERPDNVPPLPPPPWAGQSHDPNVVY